MALALPAAHTRTQIHPACAILGVVWARYRTVILTWITVSIALASFDRVNYGTTHPHGVTYALVVFALPGLSIFLPLILFVDVDPHFFVRPIGTRMLAGWHMIFGAAALMAAWALNATLLWIPLGIPSPIWWPASALAASLCLFQTIRWFPLGAGYLQAALFCIVPPLVVATSALAASRGVPSEFIVLMNAVVAGCAFPVAAGGLERLRRGDIPDFTPLHCLTAMWTIGRRARAKAFVSPLKAQVWMEWRSHGWLVPLGVGGLALLTTPLLFFPLSEPVALITILSGGKLSVQANMWANSLPVLCVTATLFLSAIVGCTDAGLRKPDTCLNSVFATRPLTNLDLALAKLRTCGLSTAATLIVLLPFTALWLALPAHSGAATRPIGVFFWSCVSQYLQPEDLSLIAGVSLFLALLAFKLQADTLFVHLTGGKWIVWVYMTLTLIPLTPVFAILDYHDNPSHRPLIMEALRYIVPVHLALRSVAMGCMIATLLRRNLVSKRFLIRTATVWMAVAAAVAVPLVAGLSGVAAPVMVVTAVCLTLPGTRIALAPLALQWDRHR